MSRAAVNRSLLIGLLITAGAAGGAALLFASHRRTPRAPQSLAAAPVPVASVPALPALPAGFFRIGLRSLAEGAELRVKALSSVRVLDGETGGQVGKVPAGGMLELEVAGRTVELPSSSSSSTTSASGSASRSGTVGVRGAGVEARRSQIVLTGGLVRIGKRSYPGKLRVRVNEGSLQVFNELEIEQYLEGVLPGEIPRGFGMEAQKALAVAARTYALVQHGKHGDFDLCDGPDCQMYLGYRRTSRRGLAAVRATRHLCLWYGDALAYPFYEADCGGLSTAADDVPLKDKPAGPMPYLRMVRDAPAAGLDYCARSPYHRWARRLSRQELEDRLNRRPETEIGGLREVRFTGYDRSGRVTEVQLVGAAPAPAAAPGGVAAAAVLAPVPQAGIVRKTVTGWEFRRSVGALALKSTRMTLDSPDADTFRFSGSGNGHGLGLCQIGANGMAARGFTFRQILAHYYPGTRLRLLAGR